MPPWSYEGSFLVFRQLDEKVPEFNKYVAFLLERRFAANHYYQGSLRKPPAKFQTIKEKMVPRNWQLI